MRRAFWISSLAGLGAVLAGCSYVFDVEVVMAGETVRFQPADRSWGAPDCAKTVTVREAADNRAIVWDAGSVDGGCNLSFPVTYGVAPQDAPVEVSAKSLEIGKTYEVDILAEGSGYGETEFVYRP